MNNQSSNAEEASNDDRFFDWLRDPSMEPELEFEPDEVFELLELDTDLSSLPATRSDRADSDASASDLPPVGEIHAVQTRFNALIERRLRVEIERNLPLFPWESRVMDYDLETARDETVQLAWLRRLRELELPVSLPDSTLVSIFARCQELARQPIQEGLQLVRAIEHLFPNAERLVHELTGAYLKEATVRDDTSLKERALDLARSGGNLPQSFENASTPQQVLLAVLAARDIFQDLTLDLTPRTPRVERQWSLETGDLAIVAEAIESQHRTTLRVSCQVPVACMLRLGCDVQQTVRDRGDAGDVVTLELPEAIVGLVYTLEVDSGQPHTTPLQFSIRLDA